MPRCHAQLTKRSRQNYTEPTKPSSAHGATTRCASEAHSKPRARGGLAAGGIGLVVQPGSGVRSPPRRSISNPRARGARASSSNHTPHMVYEAHSTDYQNPQSLRALVERHFAILKVGPGLTFALREALWALDQIERVARLGGYSQLASYRVCSDVGRPEVLEQVLHRPGTSSSWIGSTASAIAFATTGPSSSGGSARSAARESRGESDRRSRCCSQYMPLQYEAVRGRELTRSARELVLHHVSRIPQQYLQPAKSRAG